MMEVFDLRKGTQAQPQMTHEDLGQFDKNWDEANRFRERGLLGGGQGFHSFDYPFLYDAERDQMMIGPYGMFHLDMLNLHPDPGHGRELAKRYLRDFSQHEFGTGGRIKPHGPAAIVDYSWTPPEDRAEEIEHHIGQVFGKPALNAQYADSSDEEDWGTGVSSAPKLDWSGIARDIEAQPSASMGRFSATTDVQEVSTGKGDPLDPTWGIRRPFIVRDGIIHMGDPGSHHPWVAKAIGSSMYYDDGTYPGFVWTQPTPDADGKWLDWHMMPPEPLKSEVEETIADAFPQYVWTPGNNEHPGWSTEKDEDDWSQPGTFSKTADAHEDYYRQVARYAERLLAEGDGIWDAIMTAFGMVHPPQGLVDPESTGPKQDEVNRVKAFMGKGESNTPTPTEDVEHVYKPAGRKSDYYGWRVPVLYYPASGQVVTGDSGDFHGDISLRNGGQSYEGMIGLRGQQGPQGEQYTPGFTWLDGAPNADQHRAVVRSLTKFFPEAATPFRVGKPEEDDFDWSDEPGYVPQESRFKDEGDPALNLRLGFAEAVGVNPIQVHNDEDTSEMLNDRVPWIYHHPTGNLFLGKPGYFHHNIKTSPEYAQGVGGFPQPATEGWTWLNTGEYDYEEPFPDDYTHYAVKGAIQDHFGRPLQQTKPFTHEDWADLMEN